MEQDWGRRHDLVTLEDEMIASMLQPVFPGRTVDTAELLTSGKCNTNYKISVSGLHEPVVLRLHVRDRASGQKECNLLHLVEERVPVPRILYTSVSNEQGGFPYTIMSWVDGILFSGVLTSQDETAIAACAHEIGITLANIGTYTFPQAGFFGPDLTIAEDLEDVDLLSYFEYFLFAGQSGHHLGAALTQRVWRFLKDHAAYFDTLKGARSLVHSDFKGFNILVRQVQGHWKVAGVLDWEFAFAGSPLVDIGNMLRYSHLHPPAFEKAFLNGYREQGGRLPAEWKRVAKLIDLLSLCEFLNAPTPRDGLVQEVTGLITGTLEQWEEYSEQIG